VWEREGQGWRLAWDARREPFPVLIGGSDWASELTELEARSLAAGLITLMEQHSSLANTLMEEELVALEFSASLAPDSAAVEATLWLSLEGDRADWSLRLLLQPSPGLRGLEGSWERGAAAPFAKAFAQLIAALDPQQRVAPRPLDPAAGGE
jgi:hypothetical protein